jgi:membrane-bound ClpP family serine protease
MAMVRRRRLDVITEGDYIHKGDRVRITEVQGNVHVVVKEPTEKAV